MYAAPDAESCIDRFQRACDEAADLRAYAICPDHKIVSARGAIGECDGDVVRHVLIDPHGRRA
ncbi:hypothetical protein D9M70_579460 [compost metagenome]